METNLAGNLAAVRTRIENAAKRAGRNADEIKLIAVSKTHPAETIRDAISLGVTAFGENRVQEAEAKIADLGQGRGRWHLIGHLQSNKARRAVQLFDVIQSVDSVELATRLERICEELGRETLSVFIQVDLAREVTKSGVAEEDLPALADYLTTCRRLRLVGLMLLPPYFDDPESARPYFRRLREVRNNIAARDAFAEGAGELSMGMTHDFEIAIEEGATVVRIGTAIFGERGTHP